LGVGDTDIKRGGLEILKSRGEGWRYWYKEGRVGVTEISISTLPS
jgi:hypothetical protein